MRLRGAGGEDKRRPLDARGHGAPGQWLTRARPPAHPGLSPASTSCLLQPFLLPRLCLSACFCFELLILSFPLCLSLCLFFSTSSSLNTISLLPRPHPHPSSLVRSLEPGVMLTQTLSGSGVWPAPVLSAGTVRAALADLTPTAAAGSVGGPGLLQTRWPSGHWESGQGQARLGESGTRQIDTDKLPSLS